VSTLVCFHAHPDDESIATGGSIARAAAEGHRVVLVMGTDGRHGEKPADLGEGESLQDRRKAETERSAEVLGVKKVYWLGYHDSGMTGWPQNTEPNSFIGTDVETAAQKLAKILQDEQADVFTCYDWHGGYGHPDHIQVHRVGHRAADIAIANGQKIRVLESTMNRTRIAQMLEQLGGGDFDPEAPADDGNPFGTLQEEITMAVDVSEFVQVKRSSIMCHASQVTDSSMFLQMPPEAFAIAFGEEFFIEVDQLGGAPRGWFM
jgi:LmbE family N-acetylglucosaminyl deacetylase